MRRDRRERTGAVGTTTAVFVLPATTEGQQGPVAAWVSTAGWASAGRRVLGDAWIATPSGVVDPDEARRRGSHAGLSTERASRWRRRVPSLPKTAVKDVREWRRARRFHVPRRGPWDDADVAFVWQRHELFATAGMDLARALDVPAVLFVPSTRVWEAAQWGVRRPGWSAWLERVGERPALRGADLVACGSEPVAEQACRLGVPEGRILITPSGVDLDLFATHRDPRELRARLGLEGRFVIGWAGSFRRFHAVEQAVEAASAVPDAALLLVGDGPERPRIERLAHDQNVEAVFTGTVPHAELAAHLEAMDAALLLASAGATFHYSPLKLAEYLAAGAATVAPRVPEIAERVDDGVEAILVPPGDTDALVRALRKLADDPAERRRLGAAGRAAAAQRWSWDHQIHRVVDALAAGARV